MTSQQFKDSTFVQKWFPVIRWVIAAGVALVIGYEAMATDSEVEALIQAHEEKEAVLREGLGQRLDRIEQGLDDLNSYLRKDKP